MMELERLRNGGVYVGMMGVTDMSAHTHNLPVSTLVQT